MEQHSFQADAQQILRLVTSLLEIMESTLKITLREDNLVSSFVLVVVLFYPTVLQLVQVRRLTTGLEFSI